MKNFITTIMVVCFATSLCADNYKILQMNTKTIKIGDHICKIGDVFSDDSIIHWINNKQALKAQNMVTKEILLFVGQAFQKKQSKSIKDYYIKNNRLSARAFGLSEMEEMLSSETFYLLDTIKIESPVPVDSTRYFYLSFQDGEKNVRIILPMQNDELRIERSMFRKADVLNKIKVSMSYTCKGIDEDYLLTNSMQIMFIPKEITSE